MSFDPKDAAQKANLVDIAYTMFDEGGLQPLPPQELERAGYELTHYLQGKDFDTPSFYGYLAVSTGDPADWVLVVRGTEGAPEWLLDFSAVPVLFEPHKEAGFVALGFLVIYQTFTLAPPGENPAKLINVIQQVATQRKIKSLTVIGHSLGGALATLAAAELAFSKDLALGNALTLYTFASPRVGFPDFATFFDKHIGAGYRVWNELDIVPQLPTFPPFMHVSGEGDKITQTAAQLSHLAQTIPCEHHIENYMWLLDPGSFSITSDCNLETAAYRAKLVQFGGVAPGVEAIVLAMHGHR
jgi:triacylglycerol lipase